MYLLQVFKTSIKSTKFQLDMIGIARGPPVSWAWSRFWFSQLNNSLWFLVQDQCLGNWQLRRQVGNGSPITYKFPHKFTLKAGGTVTVRPFFSVYSKVSFVGVYTE